MISFQNKLEQKKIQMFKTDNHQPLLWHYGFVIYIYNYIYIYTHDIPLSHWKYQVYTKSQEASGAAALAQALVEGGLMAIEVGAGDIKWSLAMELPSSHRCPLASHVDPKKTQIYIPDQLFFFPGSYLFTHTLV